MHNSTFSVAQCGMPFPLTTGVKADYMAKEVIVKTHTHHFRSDHSLREYECHFSTKLHESINAYTFPPMTVFVIVIKVLSLLIAHYAICGVFKNKGQCIDF